MQNVSQKKVKLSRMLLGSDGDVALDPIVQALTLASGLLMLGNIVISPLLVDLAVLYKVSAIEMGVLITSYNAPTVFLVLFIGIMADRIGRKPMLIFGLLLFGLTGAAIGFFSSFNISIILRIFQGIGFACATPIVTAILGDMYDGSREATAQGLRTSGNNFVSIIAPVLASILIGISWRLPFVLFLSVLPIAMWIWIVVPSKERESMISLSLYRDSIIQTLKDSKILIVNITVLFRFLCYFGFLTYISFIGKQTLQLSTVAVGFIIGAKSILSFISSTQAGRVSKKFDSAFSAMLAFLLSGVGFFLIGIIPSVASLIIGSVLFGIGDGLINPIQKSQINALSTKDVRGGSIAFSTGVGNLGKALAPALFALILTTYDIATIFTVMGIFSVVSALLNVSIYKIQQNNLNNSIHENN